MDGLEHVFLGLVAVGVGLAVRALQEYRAETDSLFAKVLVFEQATEHARRTAEEETARAEELQGRVDALKAELAGLRQKEESMVKKVGKAEKELDEKDKSRGKFKVQSPMAG